MEVLHAQLVAAGVFRAGETLSDHPEFEFIFKNGLCVCVRHSYLCTRSHSSLTHSLTVWADNADRVSLLYAGSGALKTDYTRTGRRSRWGVLMDGINTLKRYYAQNFCDGDTQDAISLVTGEASVTVKSDAKQPSVREASLWVCVCVCVCLVLYMFHILFSLSLSLALVFHCVWVGTHDDIWKHVCGSFD